MTGRHIVVVDDDPKVRTLLRRCFEGEGLSVSEAANGRELQAQLEAHAVALITLDLNLGAENGLDLARQVRQKRNIPIIMPAREMPSTVFRRSNKADAPETSGQRFTFDGWLLDVNCRQLSRRTGRAVDLTTGEFNLLAAFVKRPHRVLSRDNIMDLLKGHDWSPLDRSIDNLVARLRKKIEPDPDHPRLIKTVRSVGYMLAVDVRREP